MEHSTGHAMTLPTMTMAEDQRTIRMMVLNSYQDMLDGQGRDYRAFFAEMEKRYEDRSF